MELNQFTTNNSGSTPGMTGNPQMSGTGNTQGFANAGKAAQNIQQATNGSLGIGNYPNTTPGLADQNGAVNAYGIPYTADSYASLSEAAIARQDWGRYQQYFQPLEQKLADMVGNNGYAQKQVSDANSNFTNQFDQSKGEYQRDLNRYGMTMNAQEQQSYNRLSSESRSLGSVNAINSANRGVGQLEMSVLGGNASNPLTTALQQLPPNALGK